MSIMGSILSEAGKTLAKAGIEIAAKTIEAGLNEFSARMDVSPSRIEYPSRFEEAPETYNPYDAADPYYDGAAPQHVADLPADPYAGFEQSKGQEFARGGKIDNLTEMLNSDAKLKEIGEVWTPQEVNEVFFSDTMSS